MSRFIIVTSESYNDDTSYPVVISSRGQGNSCLSDFDSNPERPLIFTSREDAEKFASRIWEDDGSAIINVEDIINSTNIYTPNEDNS